MDIELIIASQPKKKEIEFEGIEEKLYGCLEQDEIPSELDVLSTHTKIEEVIDVEIESVVIRGGEIKVKGNASVEVNYNLAQTGSRMIKAN